MSMNINFKGLWYGPNKENRTKIRSTDEEFDKTALEELNNKLEDPKMTARAYCQSPNNLLLGDGTLLVVHSLKGQNNSKDNLTIYANKDNSLTAHELSLRDDSGAKVGVGCKQLLNDVLYKIEDFLNSK